MSMEQRAGVAASLERVAEQALAQFSAKNAAREVGLRLSREMIRTSANSIRAVHRGEFERAGAGVRHAGELLTEARLALRDHSDIYHAGFLHDAAKEYAEAAATLALIAGRPLPTPEDLAVEWPAYLNGLGEAVGELRRFVLDLIRRGEVERCEPVLAQMEEIYAVLITMDFPEAVTSGLRRTTDATRGILERTRGDLTVALAQLRLERKLADFGLRLDS